jgi:hypothetical protein
LTPLPEPLLSPKIEVLDAPGDIVARVGILFPRIRWLAVRAKSQFFALRANRFPRLQFLCLDRAGSELFRIIPALPSALTTLEIKDTNIDDDTMRVIAQFVRQQINLRELSLIDTTHSHIEDLISSAVAESSLTHFRHIAAANANPERQRFRFDILTLPHSKLQSADFEIGIGNEPFVDLVCVLKSCPDLRSLTVYDTKRFRSLDSVRSYSILKDTNITELTLVSVGVVDQDLNILASELKDSKLTKLHLRQSDFGYGGLLSLCKALPSSKVMDFSLLCSNLYPVAVPESLFRGLPGSSLTSLKIGGFLLPVKCDIGECIASSALHTLTIVNCDEFRRQASSFAQHLSKSKLTNLNLSHNDIRSDCLLELISACRSSQVRALVLYQNPDLDWDSVNEDFCRELIAVIKSPESQICSVSIYLEKPQIQSIHQELKRNDCRVDFWSPFS